MRNRLGQLRADRSEVENHYIDELIAGRLDRRDFLRRGAVLGMSSALMGVILEACGGANSNAGGTGASSSSAAASSGAPKTGGTLRLALLAPGAQINPLTTNDTGNVMLMQTGEYLIFDNNLERRLVPALATSWSHNGDGSVWTFKLRQGVKFHDGSEMTADDVVYTFKQNSDPHNAANALATFQGVLTPAGVVKVDAHTVEFHLEAPNGNFPYLVSSDNYNTIIVPNNTDFSKWHSTFIGTGGFKFGSYTPNEGATFVRNPDWWGGKTPLDGTRFSFYASASPQVLALEGGQVDVIVQFSASGGQAVLKNPSFKIVSYDASVHRELSLRNDIPPFNDARVRRAVALTLNRPAMVNALLSGYGQVGNDNPFAPLFVSRNTSVPQRIQDLTQAKQLLAAAGHPNGVTAPLYTEINQEIPLLAQSIKAYAANVGINLELHVETQDQYYGKSTFGNSDWLDGAASLVDYGSRGVPNVFLQAPLLSNGPWNAAHFKDPSYDRLVAQYIAAVDLQSQRRIAGQIEQLLLEQTPIVIPYWLNGLTATTTHVHGVNPTAIPQIDVTRAYID
ncbi:MAG: ABC transporter substrate-binding protein [Solirubrobacteraceae bacterium]